MTIELYLKAGHKGNDVGDCPFAQFIRCILNHKDISYDLKPCTQETKPEWLLKDFEGRLPCLMHNGKGTIESSDIADYIEKTFPQKSLKTPEEVSKEVLVFFPAMVKLFLEDLLTSSGGPYLSGASETLADYSLAPKLFHMTAIVPEFHPKVYEKLKNNHFPN
ncbi:DHAR [Lepeophtheirus salmonis]|uniref:DHAR n=1 Tax=Lepeophtheirus salmonis TaxID=72036 RepID=A0A7R8HAM3_LEPSM|nr:DHAR [Lepeophtheirus salmonis]CAF2969021.1 DHAR [Lepeophtheirus salmonis]